MCCSGMHSRVILVSHRTTWCKPVSKSHGLAIARVCALCKHIMTSHSSIIDTNQKFCCLAVTVLSYYGRLEIAAQMAERNFMLTLYQPMTHICVMGVLTSSIRLWEFIWGV